MKFNQTLFDKEYRYEINIYRQHPLSMGILNVLYIQK